SVGVALGISSLALGSEKMGLTSRVQSGHMAGGAVSRRADRTPATGGPCKQGGLWALPHPAGNSVETLFMLWLARSGWLRKTGPSIRPILISGRPLVRAISGARVTTSNGSITVPAVVTVTRETVSGDVSFNLLYAPRFDPRHSPTTHSNALLAS